MTKDDERDADRHPGAAPVGSEGRAVTPHPGADAVGGPSASGPPTTPHRGADSTARPVARSLPTTPDEVPLVIDVAAALGERDR